MIFFGGKKERWAVVPNGRVEIRECPRCLATARFLECKRTTTYTVYFIDILDLTEAVFLCSSCCQLMSLADTLPPSPTHPEAQRMALEREEAAKRADRERRRVERERARAEAQRENAIERQLRALKKRMSKGGS